MWPVYAVATIAIFQYLNAAQCSYAFDDHLAVEGNADADWRLDTGWSLWHNDFWGKDLRALDSHKSWRPLTVLSFRAEHALFAGGDGGHSATVSHVVNMLLHAVASAAVFKMIRARLHWASEAPAGGASGGWLLLCWNDAAAFIAAIIFAVHPVHVEAVTGVVGRADILCAICVLLALRLYRSTAETADVRTLAAFVVVTWVAIFTKEIGITVLAIVGVGDISLALVRAADPTRPRRGFASALLGRALRRWPWCLACGVFYISLRLLVTTASGGAALGLAPYGVPAGSAAPPLPAASAPHGSGDGDEDHSPLALISTLVRIVTSGEWRDSTLERSGLVRRTENPFAFINGTLPKVLSLGYLQARWASLLIAPATLCAEYSYNCIPTVTSIADPRNAGTVLLVLTLGMLLRIACFLGRRGGAQLLLCGRPSAYDGSGAGSRGTVSKVEVARGRAADARWGRQQHTLRFALSLAIFPFLPASNLFTTVGTLIAERLLYVPSIGFMLGCVVLAQMRRDARTDAAAASDYAISAAAHSTSSSGGGSSAALGAPARRWSAGRLRTTFLVLVVAWSAQRTWLRTNEWKNDRTLFTAAVASCPNSAKIHQQLGQILFNLHSERVTQGVLEHEVFTMEDDLLQEAFDHYQTAKALDPEFCEVDLHLGLYYARPEIGKIDDAMRLFRGNIGCVFSNTKSFINLQKVWRHMRNRRTVGVPNVAPLNHRRLFGDNATLIVEQALTWGVIGSEGLARQLWAEAGAYLAGRAVAAKEIRKTYLLPAIARLHAEKNSGEVDEAVVEPRGMLRVVRVVFAATVGAEIAAAAKHGATGEGRRVSQVDHLEELGLSWERELEFGAQERGLLLLLEAEARGGQQRESVRDELAALDQTIAHVRRLATIGAIQMFSQVVAWYDMGCGDMRGGRKGEESMRWPRAEGAELMAAHRWLAVLYDEMISMSGSSSAHGGGGGGGGGDAAGPTSESLELVAAEEGDAAAEWTEEARRHALFSKRCAGFVLPMRTAEEGADNLEAVLEARDQVSGTNSQGASDVEVATWGGDVNARSVGELVGKIEREVEAERVATSLTLTDKIGAGNQVHTMIQNGVPRTLEDLRLEVPSSIVAAIGELQGRMGETPTGQSEALRDEMAARLEMIAMTLAAREKAGIPPPGPSGDSATYFISACSFWMDVGKLSLSAGTQLGALKHGAVISPTDRRLLHRRKQLMAIAIDRLQRVVHIDTLLRMAEDQVNIFNSFQYSYDFTRRFDKINIFQ